MQHQCWNLQKLLPAGVRLPRMVITCIITMQLKQACSNTMCSTMAESMLQQQRLLKTREPQAQGSVLGVAMVWLVQLPSRASVKASKQNQASNGPRRVDSTRADVEATQSDVSTFESSIGAAAV